MITRRNLVFAASAAAAGCGRRKGSGFPGYAFVANQEGRAIAAVDLTAFAVATHIRLESAPTAVIAHPARPVVYALTPASGEVHEIDGTTLRVRRRVRAGQSCDLMRLSHDGLAMYVASSVPRSLVRLDVEALRIVRRIDLPSAAADFDVAPDGPSVVAACEERLVVADTSSGTVRAIAAREALTAVRFRSDGKMLMAAEPAARSLAMFDTATGRTVVRLPLAVRPDHLVMKADGGQLFITGDGMDAVVLVYPYSTEVAETVLAGKKPGAMAECRTPDANLLFVASPTSGEVSIMDIETRKVIAVVAVGREPVQIGMTPDNQYALVLNRTSGDIAVIRTLAIAANRRRSAPLFTMIPVGSGPVSVAVQRA